MIVDAVIVAAGSSTRFGAVDKLHTDLAGQPVLAWSLNAFQRATSVGRIVIVTALDAVPQVEALVKTSACERVAAIVPGGARRRDSVESGLLHCSTRYVAIHDGARPLVTADLIERCIAAADHKPGAIAAVPVTDTIKQVRGHTIIDHPDRARLWAAQTPQVVLRDAWLRAAAASDNDETDDAAMLSRLGLECDVVESSADNLKITRPMDIELARQILVSRGAR